MYLPHFYIDELIAKATSPDSLIESKKLILSHIFTLRKENRHLLRRISSMEAGIYSETAQSVNLSQYALGRK